MNNLTKRVLTAAVGVPAILLVLYFGGIPFLLFILAIMVLGSVEYFSIIESSKYKPDKYLIIIGSVAIGIGAYICSFIFMFIFTLAVMAYMLTRLREEDFTHVVKMFGIAMFPLVYFGWMLSHGIMLRNIGENIGIINYSVNTMDLNNPGFFFVVLVFACTFMNDTGAYFAGKSLGRNKLSPVISPGKTVEGTVGGLAVSVITAYVFNLLFSSPLPFIWVVIFGLLIGASAVIGDLVESSIKRGGGVKDSGGIVPGHGGILDRFDSFFFVFPVAYYLTVFFYYFNGAVVY